MVQSTTLTLGMDVGDRFTQFCLLPVMGEDPVEVGRVATTPAGISEFLGGRPRCRVVFEVGCHSPRINDLAEEAGHEVFVANPRELAFIRGNNRKSARVDAERLARVGRLDPKLLSPIHHRGQDARRDLLVLRVRDALVSERSKLVNTVRGLVQSTGHRIKSCSTVCFARTARESLPADLAEPLAPLLDSIEQISGRIRELDRKAEELCARKYPETAVLLHALWKTGEENQPLRNSPPSA